MAEQMDIDMEGPRGIKRKADEANLPSEAPRRIKALEQDVINKIAAGEIIVAPMHALKELIENAVDAGSTSLEILVKDGGLKLLQITDNGHGINRDDLPILCERFTTSKLKAFEDLSSMTTYGFRGEALASISHIAHLTVTTKTADSSCAWRAHYADGKLVPAKPGQSPDPKACAGRGGTQITVEDLFYNVPTRRRAFRSSSEEYAKILDLVGRYAIHCSGVAFSCKKHGDSNMGISTQSHAKIIDRIRQIYGAAVANELLPFESSSDAWGFKATGYSSSANYHAKRLSLLLFINHRSVESSALKKAIEQTYSTFLPKGGHPFVYLSLEIEPQRIDVNVHPTKREVNFLNEDEIIEQICEIIRAELAKVDTSRTFMTQTLLPGTTRIPTITSEEGRDFKSPVRASGSATNVPKTPHRQIGPSPSTTRKRSDNNLVRTDPNLRKITSMLPPGSPSAVSQLTPQLSFSQSYTISPDRVPTQCRLASIKHLRAEVREALHTPLSNMLSTHTFIGIVDSNRRIAAIQAGVKLLLVDYGMISNEFFYQLGLTDFGNFGEIRFDPPLSTLSLLQIAAAKDKDLQASKNDTSSPIDTTILPRKILSHILGRRDMLSEYFSLKFTNDGDLESIPLLLKGYTPSIAKLPRFLLRLGPCINWTNEQECFRTFLHELAAFYTPEQLPARPMSTTADKNVGNESTGPVSCSSPKPLGPSNSDPKDRAEELLQKRREELAYVIEHTLFPAFRARIVATKGLLKGVIEVADLKGLYRVFERC
ncbi:MAG: DNA mismatch repair protein [Cirrosporium novae-zelandiae]|nr:MAG: DNA mismatch repair protein [Cirrosporium novae-zelandiae]KAI9735565.1 MAG: DNA mismatch repair protein [Cirrosporium novae-zelandiae]